jgi:glyoxylase I family protein
MLHHVALRCADLARAEAFYHRVLGLPVLARHDDERGAPRSSWLSLGGGAVLMLERALRGAGAEAGTGHLLALAVDDLDRWALRLAAAGVAIDDRSAATLYLRDPDGHRVGLSTYHFEPAK